MTTYHTEAEEIDMPGFWFLVPVTLGPLLIAIVFLALE